MDRVTIAYIASRGHKLADVPESSSARSVAVIGESEGVDVVNDGLAELHDLLMECHEDYLTVRDTIDMASGDRSTRLPDAFLKLRAPPYLLDSASNRVELYEFKLQEMGGVTTTETADYPQFRVMNTRIYWHPLPSTARTIEIWYTQQFYHREDVEAEIHPVIPFGWEALPIAHYAEYLLCKLDMDPTTAIMKKQAAIKRIRSAAPKRNASGPMKTRDVNQRYSRGPRFPTPRV